MYEYKVIPAPLRTVKVKGLSTPAERFAHLLEGAVNAEAGDGWEFVRAETLPCEERKGLTGTAKSFQSVLIFRRTTGFAGQSHADIDDAGTDLADGQHSVAEHAGAGKEQPALSRGDTPTFAAPRTETGAASEPAPRLSLVATRHEAEVHAPPPPPAQTGRQEPVFRPGAARHGTGTERPEPVLRTRAVDEGDKNA
jgi:hypothetical protein